MAEAEKKEENPTLEWAWKRFALYDDNSKQLKRHFKALQKWILVLGVLVTFLVLSQTELITQNIFKAGSPFERALQYAIIALPIIITILTTVSNRFKPGETFLLLRAGAESVKREIYRYRVHAHIPDTVENEDRFNEEKLVEKINNIHNHLMDTELNRRGLTPYKGSTPPPYGTAPGDDGFKPLSPAEYLKYRLEDQLNFYQGKTNGFEKKLKRLHWLIYIFGGLGTFLAAIGLELWVALTTALAGTFTTHLEYQQVENTLMLYNQSAASLSQIKSRWDVLPPREKNKPENVFNLLEKTEDVLLAEHKRWVQQMEDTLANLREQQKQPEEKEERS